jgi:hypothetical protein
MKIINNTNTMVEYLITPSGCSPSSALASGWVSANSGLEFSVSNAPVGPWVYLKFNPSVNSGYVCRQVSALDSVLNIQITEK